MNELLEKKLLTYLEKFEGAAEKAADFSAEQVPLVVQEYLQFMFIENVVSFAVAFISFLGMVSIPFFISYVSSKMGEDKETNILAFCLASFSVLFFHLDSCYMDDG